jgi:hypothetical protein
MVAGRVRACVLLCRVVSRRVVLCRAGAVSSRLVCSLFGTATARDGGGRRCTPVLSTEHGQVVDAAGLSEGEGEGECGARR